MQISTKTITALSAAIALAGFSSAYAATPTQVTASTAQSGNPASNTLDGSLDTRWSAQGEGQWIQYDFGEPVTLAALKVAFFKGDSRTSTFQIESSEDSYSWQPQPMSQADGSSTELQSYSLSEDITAQYFRIVGYGNSSNDWNSITEVEFVDGQAPKDDDDIGYCQAITLTASADDGNVASNAMDGDLSTRWSANGDGQTLTQDWCGATHEFNAVEIAFYKGDTRSSTFSIEVNNNGAWTTAIAKTSSASDTTGYQTFYFDQALSGQAVRYTGYGNSSNSWNSLTEFNAIICDSSAEEGCGFIPTACDIDYFSAECLDQRCSTDPNGEGCPIVCTDCSVDTPDDLMENYKQWKITLPIGENVPDGDDDPTNNGSPVEIKDLAGVSNEYYYVNAEGTGIVFYAPVNNDNAATKNSTYIRSELREREEDGSKDVYWTTDGKHVIYVKQAITHLPIVKSHLVATQIHGNKDEGIDDALVLRLEDEHLFLSFNGGKLRDDVTVKTDYSLGTVHEVIFEVIDGKHYVYYSEDGNLKNAFNSGNASSYLVKDGSSDYVMDKSYGEAYFKVGNYTQSNVEKEGDETGNPDNYGEVVVYDFSVDHQ